MLSGYAGTSREDEVKNTVSGWCLGAVASPDTRFDQAV